MKIIDAFCGLGATAKTDRSLPLTTEAILEVLDACGVDQAVIYSNQVHMRTAIADANALTDEAATACQRFIPMWVVTTHPHRFGPDPDDYAQRMQAAGVRIAFLRPGSVQAGLHGWIYGDLADMGCQTRLPLVISMTDQPPNEVHDLARAWPELRLILTHVDYHHDAWVYPLLSACPQVRLSLAPSYVPPLGVQRFVDHFGPERLIFGSGLPEFSPGGQLAAVMYADIAPDDKQRIVGGNVQTLMREVAW